MGVSVGEIINALQVYFGSLYVNDFNLFGRTWQVNVQAERSSASGLADLKRIQVRNNRMARWSRVGGFISVKDATGPVMIQRYNLYPALAVNATPAPGVSSGRGHRRDGDAAAANLPPDDAGRVDRTGPTSAADRRHGACGPSCSAWCSCSWCWRRSTKAGRLPLAVILVVPMCLLSAAAGVRAAGQDINIFTQVGFVVLVGLACKNAILIVEFAKQQAETRRQPLRGGARGLPAAVAADRDDARSRSSSAWCRCVLAEGPGRRCGARSGTAVFAGMIGVTLFGIFLTPVFFVVVRRVTEEWGRRRDCAASRIETEISLVGQIEFGHPALLDVA